MTSGAGLALLGDVSFATAFDSLPDPMVIVDDAGVIAALNHGAEDMLGYAGADLIGQPIELLVPDAARDGHRELRAGYSAQSSPRPMGRGLDLAARCPDGSTIPVDISLSPLEVDGRQFVLVALRDTTAQRLVEETLAAFAFIVRSSVDAIYQVDRTGRIISWNPAAARMTGHGEADVIGGQPDLLFPPHRRGEEADVLRRALLGERIERRETELERLGGLLVPVELTASPLLDRSGRVVGASVIAHDITEQRLAQDFLADSQARLQEAQELASVGMWTWDLRTDSVQYSEPLYRILDVDPNAFSGVFDELVGCVVADQRESVRDALRAAGRTGDPVRLECGVVRSADGDGWVSIRAEVERASGGDVIGLRGIVQDLTDRHRAEVAVRDALVRERHAAEQLRAADRLKDEFLSTVSHELRTPLTSIIGLVEVMVDRGGSVDDLAPDLIRRIQRNAEEMRSMIERLLDFSRLEAGRVVLHPAAVRLRGVVDQSVVQADVALADHPTVVDVDEDLLALADSDALTRVLVNLLTNAAKFSPLGSTVHIAAREEGTDLVVSVRDEGVGLDEATACRVFERFFQVEGDQRAGKRGTGVGLSIVQRYVEMHGGRVWVDSEVGGGATFSFSLPSTSRSRP